MNQRASEVSRSARPARRAPAARANGGKGDARVHNSDTRRTRSGWSRTARWAIGHPRVPDDVDICEIESVEQGDEIRGEHTGLGHRHARRRPVSANVVAHGPPISERRDQRVPAGEVERCAVDEHRCRPRARVDDAGAMTVDLEDMRGHAVILARGSGAVDLDARRLTWCSGAMGGAGEVHPRAGWASAVLRALTPTRAPWAVRPAARTVAIAALVLAGGLIVAEPQKVGIAYFGVACAAVFVGRGDYRVRSVMVAAQAAGAVSGMVIGAAVPASAPWVIGASVVVGWIAGALGRIGPAATACAMMAVIGVAYTQFLRLEMPWWEPPTCYLIGSALLLMASVVGALTHPDRYRRAAVAAVFTASADLVRAAGGVGVDEMRHRLALASAAAREAMVGYRLRPLQGGWLTSEWLSARDAARHAAAVAVARGRIPPEDADRLAQDWVDIAAEIHRGDRRAGSTGSIVATPGLVLRLHSAARASTDHEAVLAGARLAVCVGVATGLAVLLHPPQHAYWIPLTVATVVRPEYGSVLVRSLHRLVGTLLGVILIAALVAAVSHPLPLAACAAIALGLAVLAAPRLYSLAVIGVTGSALLSIAVGTPDDLEPWSRLIDTVLGCAVALVIGVVAWPARGLPDQHRAFITVLDAVVRHVDLELDPDAPAGARAAARDDAYRRAHAWRAELERDQAELDPSRSSAEWLPVALQLERTVDAVCAGALQADDGMPLSESERQSVVTLLNEARTSTDPRLSVGILAKAVSAAARYGDDKPTI